MQWFVPLLGKTVRFDIFNDQGVLLIPEKTRLTMEHVHILQSHRIELSENDVVMSEPKRAVLTDKQIQALDESVQKVQELFGQIRDTQQVPIDDIREEVLPAVQHITDGSGLSGLLAALQEKDDFTYRHNISVSLISAMLGKWLGLSEQEVAQLSVAAMLHDIGKVRLPEELLTKTELTDEEFGEWQKHTVYGYEMLKESAGIDDRQALVALQHHERMDGSGFPNGLTGEQIDLFSRIVMVADIFHNKSSRHKDGEANPFYEVLQQLEEMAFGKLDPEPVRVFIHKTMQFLLGHEVTLKDGQVGKIILIHPHDPIRPLVQVGDDFVDLSKDNTNGIEKITEQ